MLYTKSGNKVSKIGIGTWTINKNNVDQEVDALMYYFNNGVNYIDVVLAYDNGAVVDVVAKFLRKINREDIFINAFITFGCKEPADIQKQIDWYLNKLNTNYLDCVSLHSLDAIGFSLEQYIDIIESLRATNKFVMAGYSNLSPEQLDKYRDNIQLFEGLYNLECKINEDNGIINQCLHNDIPFFAYQPLRRNRTAKQNYPCLVTFAQKYNKTQNQIIINWLTKHKNIQVLIKSSNINHIAENLASLNFDMQQEDYVVLDEFRNKEFDNLQVCYKTEEGKIRIDQVPNQPIGIL